jgi:hypothetical protein
MRSLLRYTLLATLLAGPTMLRANVLTVTHLDGSYDYLFTLLNPAGSNIPVFDVYIVLPTADPNVILTVADLTLHLGPTGWGDDTGGFFFANALTPGSPGVFFDWVDTSDVYDLHPGDSAGYGFSASVPLTGDMYYALNGNVEQFGPVSLDNALALPEPAGTAGLISAGLVALAILRRMRRPS